MTKESEIEREAVVRWLRWIASLRSGDAQSGDAVRALDLAADFIERGDHLKERG